MLTLFRQTEGSFDGGDQGLLNQHFSGWSTDADRRLPFLYNVVPGSFYSYTPAFRQYQADIKVVHFIGPNKPWMRANRAGASEAGELHAYWWTVHESMRGAHGAPRTRPHAALPARPLPAHTAPSASAPSSGAFAPHQKHGSPSAATHSHQQQQHRHDPRRGSSDQACVFLVCVCFVGC